MQRRKTTKAAGAQIRRKNPQCRLPTVAGSCCLAAALAWLALLPPASAQDIENLGEFGNWGAYAFDEQGEKACFMASRPVKDEGDYEKRGEIFAIVTHRPADKSRDVVSLEAGYKYKAESPVKVSIDGKDFNLAPHEETAWAGDEVDRALVAAMKAGNLMVVEGVSARGTETKDTYSLKGFTKAYQTIGKACGV